ncbi:MAG: phosphotransferase [Novosphingobium sp.]|nr:phosphotransferase [Novosphingobium sp.]
MPDAMEFEPAPLEMETVLNPAWLERALCRDGQLVEIEKVELVETIGWNCLNLRVKLTFADRGQPEGLPERLCIKGLFGEQHPEYLKNGALVADTLFYTEVLPRITMKAPRCYYGGVDERGSGVVVLEDLTERDVRFFDHRTALTLDQVRDTLDQLARLHGGMSNMRPDELPWLRDKLDVFSIPIAVTPERLSEAMHGQRGDPLPEKQKDGSRIYNGLKALARRAEQLPVTAIHGDCHIGNIFETEGSFGFIDFQIVQRGHWSLDLPYHIGSVLTVEDRRAKERDLVRYYLDRLGDHGGDPPDFETAWRLYREGAAYGFFLWSVTMRVDAPIVNEAVKRLGLLVADHDSYGLLGL